MNISFVVFHARGRQTMCMPVMHRIVKVGQDLIVIELPEMPDTSETAFHGIDKDDMTYVGVFSECGRYISIGCYAEGDDVAPGKLLSKLTVDWVSKKIHMPLHYYESMFVNRQFPRGHYDDPRGVMSHGGDSGTQSCQHTSMMRVHKPSGDHVVPDIDQDEVSSGVKPILTDQLVPETSSWLHPFCDDMLPSVTMSTMHLGFQIEDMFRGILDASEHHVGDVDVTSPMSLSPHESYSIKFGSNSTLYDTDNIIHAWQKSLTKSTGGRFESFFRALRCQLSLENDSISIVSYSMDYTNVSSDSIEMYIDERIRILYPDE
jgi:hypothetical protein